MSETFNYDKLLDRMKQNRYSQTTLAEAIGISRTSMYLKIHSKQPFTQKEIGRICRLLDISNNEVGEYFFYNKEVK